MSVYDEILEKKKQDRIRYELEQRKEEIKELDKEIDRRRSINYDLSLQIIDKDKEIERLNNIITEIKELVDNYEQLEKTLGAGKTIFQLYKLQEILKENKNGTKKL